MPEREKRGTPSKAHQTSQWQTSQGKPPASSPDSGGGGVNNAATALASQDVALNPPFDSRMRRVGSPLNRTALIKRGWIQNEDGSERVNFLFNPPAIDVSSTVNPDRTQTPLQKSDMDVMNVDYTGTGSSTGVSLLYDRTYELFSQPAGPTTNPAYYFGVFSDIAAWYKFTKMYDSMPSDWSGTMFNQPLNLVPSYLFVGPRMVFYGYVTSLTTTITHWTQNMIPQRAKVDLGFTILPRPSGSPGIRLDGSGSTQTAEAATLPDWASGLFGGALSSNDGLYDSLFGSIVNDPADGRPFVR